MRVWLRETTDISPAAPPPHDPPLPSKGAASPFSQASEVLRRKAWYVTTPSRKTEGLVLSVFREGVVTRG